MRKILAERNVNAVIPAGRLLQDAIDLLKKGHDVLAQGIISKIMKSYSLPEALVMILDHISDVISEGDLETALGYLEEAKPNFVASRSSSVNAGRGDSVQTKKRIIYTRRRRAEKSRISQAGKEFNVRLTEWEIVDSGKGYPQTLTYPGDAPYVDIGVEEFFISEKEFAKKGGFEVGDEIKGYAYIPQDESDSWLDFEATIQEIIPVQGGYDVVCDGYAWSVGVIPY